MEKGNVDQKQEPCKGRIDLSDEKHKGLASDYPFDLHNAFYIAEHPFATKRNTERLKKLGYKVIFLYRDLRDYVVSFAHFFSRLPWLKHIGRLPLGKKIEILLQGNSFLYNPQERGWNDELLLETKSVADFYNLYLPWMNEPYVYTTSFEKLVGPRGGGSYDIQIQEIMNIAKHINFLITEEQARKIATQLFGGTGTFREGKIGAWKKEFSPENLTLFKSNQDNMQMLVDLGYEKDFNW